MEQKEQLCDEVKTVREFTYLGDRVSADGGCEAASHPCHFQCPYINKNLKVQQRQPS